MTVAELHIIISSALSLIVLALVAFKLWPNQRVDIFRQNMFALRDELFDFAADGNISFEDPAYVLLRELMNGFIRYAHNLTPFRTAMSFLRWKCEPHEPLNAWSDNLNRALDRVPDPNIREKLQRFHSKSTVLVLSQLMLSPGLLLVVAPIVVLTAIFYVQWSSLRAIYNSFSDRFPMAFLEGEASKS